MPDLIKAKRTIAVNGMLIIKPINQLGKYDPNIKNDGALLVQAVLSNDSIAINPNLNLTI